MICWPTSSGRDRRRGGCPSSRSRSTARTGDAMSAVMSATPVVDLDLRHAIRTVVEGGRLSADDATAAMDAIMTGGATGAQIGALVTALRMRGETVDEIAGFARAMRRHALRVTPNENGQPLVDTCGTGGDASDTFNISTTAAFVIAGAGVRVAKHGNRAVTSKCGSG